MADCREPLSRFKYQADERFKTTCMKEKHPFIFEMVEMYARMRLRSRACARLHACGKQKGAGRREGGGYQTSKLKFSVGV